MVNKNISKLLGYTFAFAIVLIFNYFMTKLIKNHEFDWMLFSLLIIALAFLAKMIIGKNDN
jgi:hypothetical protein